MYAKLSKFGGGSIQVTIDFKEIKKNKHRLTLFSNMRMLANEDRKYIAIMKFIEEMDETLLDVFVKPHQEITETITDDEEPSHD